jgi:hypothetical protein
VLDGEPQGGPADIVDDDIEVAAELLDDAPGAQAAQQLPGRGGIADQRGDDSAASPNFPPSRLVDTFDQVVERLIAEIA